MDFIGRKEQLLQLSALWRKGSASLVTCQGRRRIGKSRLLDEFALRSDCRFLKLSGLAPRKKMSNGDQLRYFCESLAAKTGGQRQIASGWPEAFRLLGKAIASLCKESRTLVVLDEVSWMGGWDADFPGYLKDAWDDDFKRNDNLIFVLCGSVSAWIQRNILDSTGFVGRISLELEVGELPARDCLGFWRQTRGSVSSKEVFDMLSVTGGVPRYLEEIDPALTTDENLRRMAFSKSGTLFGDFNRIFSDVFGRKSRTKRMMLESLACGSKTLSELAASIGKGRGGHISEALEELELAGFVIRDRGVNPETGLPAKIDRYRIRDNYTRFYLRFIAPYSAMIRGGAFKFAGLDALPGWDSILGLQFENLVLNNADALIEALGLDRSLIISAAPYRKQMRRCSSSSDGGCQIDLLLQLKQALYVVEVKRRATIDASVTDDVLEKVKRLPNPRGLSVRPVLVYEGTLSPAVNENGVFAATLRASDLLLH
jgi:AAA+ ATPase superfamily predicted ATPase